jgi:hypothetical protein
LLSRFSIVLKADPALPDPALVVIKFLSIEHDLFGKPDHALAAHRMTFGCNRHRARRPARLQRTQIADELPRAVLPGTL